MVCVHTPFSVSHTRTVESKPQLYAVCAVWFSPNTTFETRAVCDLSTLIGAFRRGFDSSSTFRRFFLSRPLFSGSGTSSVEGTVVSQRPIRPSQEDVRTCVPEEFEETDETGAVCRWSVARTLVFDGVEGVAESNMSWEIAAVRS